MKYDIGDINRLCKERPLNSVWQIIDMGTGKVFPITGFSGSFGDTSFSCHYTQKEGSKQQTSTVLYGSTYTTVKSVSGLISMLETSHTVTGYSHCLLTVEHVLDNFF